MEETIAVYLDDYQSKQFVLFQQKYLQIIKMIQAGVFDLRGGQVTIDIDIEGNFAHIHVGKDYKFSVK